MLLLPPKETLTVEFKSDVTGYSDENLVDEIVGIANTEGGTLFLGVEDDGTVTGLNSKHKNADGLEAMIANKTVPPVYVHVELISIDNKKIVRITVPKSRNIIAASDGRILRRRLKQDSSPENVPMYPFEIPQRLSGLGLVDYSAQILDGATLNDIDKNELLRLRNIIKYKNGDRTLSELADEELLLALQLAKTDACGLILPTVAGVLLTGREQSLHRLIPTATASFQVLSGTKVRKNEDSCKPLIATLELFEEYLKSWNSETEITDGLYRVSVPEFSESAYREAIINAFCHRDYTMLQPVRVAIEDEGLTVSNPGGFIEGITLNNLLTAEPRGRNQALANALKRLGLAEKTGRGIDRIYEGSIRYGRPLPDYSETTSTCVKLFIQRAKPDIPFMKMLMEKETQSGNSLSINSLLILSALRTVGRLTADELRRQTNINTSRLFLNLEYLLAIGILSSIGNGEQTTYSLNITRETSAINEMTKQRQTIQNSETYILELLDKQNGNITRDNVVKLLNVTAPQAYRLLQKLVLAGQIKVIGTGRGAHYEHT